MPDIICPNCRCVIPPFASCIQCYAALPSNQDNRSKKGIGAPTGNAGKRALNLAEVDERVMPGLDPHLQSVIVDVSQEGVTKIASSATGENEVAVIARVTDAQSFKGIPGVRAGLEIPSVDGTDKTTLLTARMAVTEIQEVRKLPFVKSLKAALRLRPYLDRTVKEIEAAPNPPDTALARGGDGVVVGVIDFGLDFAHRNFRNQEGKSRVEAIWDQGSPDGSGPFGYGKVYERNEIDAALQTDDPYGTLGYGPAPDSASGDIGSHGTHVTDIAAGNGLGSSLPGVAPNADIIFVEAGTKALSKFSAEAVGDSFGDTAQLLEAISFIFQRAGGRPCVINISLGTNGGPHDGKTLVEQGVDRLIGSAPNRAVVVAAGNSFTGDIHASGSLAKGGSTDLLLSVPSIDSTNNELEIWYSGQDRFSIDVIDPKGNSIHLNGDGSTGVPLGKNWISHGHGRGHDGAAIVANRKKDPNNLDNVIAVFLGKGFPLGTWKLRLHADEVKHDGHFHAWIERDNDNQSRFVSPDKAPANDNSCTLGSISCGHRTIVVGSYDAHDIALPLSPASSSGPTRDGRQKPDVSAPGHAVLAAYSRTKTALIRKTGTSMAAAAVAGTIALMLDEANSSGKHLDSDQIRDILKLTARKDPPSAPQADSRAKPDGGSPQWDPRYGFGRVDASAAVDAVKKLSTSVSPPRAKKDRVKPGEAASSKSKAAKTQPNIQPGGPQ